MNKAFVREPDPDAAPLCPRCRTIGQSVRTKLIEHYVAPEIRATFSGDAWACTYADCDVVYFNAVDALIRTKDLQHPAWPYHGDAPICPCFGVTYEDIVADADAPEPLRIRELLRQARTPEARCATLAIDGQCCLREVQRLYLRLRNGPG